MTLQALWDVTQQFNNKNGSILTNGKVFIYYRGRTALATTYHDEDGKVVNSNPILLDNNGRATAFANPIYSYTIVVCDYYGKELFSQDITLQDAISTAKDIVVVGTNGTVLVDNTVLPNGVQYDLAVNTDIFASKKELADLDKKLQLQKKDKQTQLTFDGSATKTVKSITQDANGVLNVEFEDIDLPQEVPNVEITSEDGTIDITSKVDTETNTKTFDLAVNLSEDAPTFGRFIANSDGLTLVKTEGNMTLSADGKIELKKGKGYHFTIRGIYYNDTLYNGLLDLSFIEYSRNESISIIVDGTLSAAQSQPFEISFDVAQRTADLKYPISFNNLTNGHLSGLTVEVHDINSVSVTGTGGTNVIIQYGQTPTQTFSQLTKLAAEGLLYAQAMTSVLQATSWSSTSISFNSTHNRYTDTWKYDVNSGWSSEQIDTAKVASANGEMPDYLGNVLQAGENVTITTDGEHVKISAAGGSATYTVLYSNDSPSASNRANSFWLAQSAFNFDYLLIDWLDVDLNARRDQVMISYMKNVSPTTEKIALSSNNFTVYVPDTASDIFGWFKWYRWYLPNKYGTLIVTDGIEYRLHTNGSIDRMGKWGGSEITVNSPSVGRITGVKLI